MMIDRRLFTPDHDDPPHPVIISDTCTVPTKEMAYLLAELLNTEGDVLELGTGSGFQAAVLAEKCRSVVTLEVDFDLLQAVAKKLPNNVMLIPANGLYYDTSEQFDGLLVTFAAASLSHVWHRQLKEGARLVVPLKVGECCKVCVYERRGEDLHLVDVPVYANFTRAITDKA